MNKNGLFTTGVNNRRRSCYKNITGMIVLPLLILVVVSVVVVVVAVPVTESYRMTTTPTNSTTKMMMMGQDDGSSNCIVVRKNRSTDDTNDGRMMDDTPKILLPPTTTTTTTTTTKSFVPKSHATTTTAKMNPPFYFVMMKALNVIQERPSRRQQQQVLLLRRQQQQLLLLLLRGGEIIRIAPPVIHSSSSSSSSSNRIDQTFSSSSITDAKEQMNAFLTRDSRNTFIARVYAILSIQLIITAITIHLFGTYPNVTIWMRQSQFGPIVPIVSLLLSTVAWITMSLSTQARRTAPMKWQLLLLFTLGEAISVGFVSSFYQYRTVVLTMIVTAITTSSISIYTAQQRNSKYDLSQFGATLSSAGLMLVLYGIIQLFQSTGIIPSGFLPYNEMIYGLIGATIFSGYLAYHTKLITAGKLAKYQMNEKDYVFGAMTLYNDIINFFVYMLKVLGEERER